MSNSMLKFSIRLRGIYSTALTKFLHENNFKITQSSDLISKRLSFNSYNVEPDLNIQDTWDKQGILCWGKQEAIDSLITLFQEHFLDAIIRKSNSGKDAFLKGRVIGINNFNNTSILDFGNFKGILENKIIPVGKYVLTKVQYPNIGKRKAMVSSNITIPGVNVILIQNSTNKISKKISNPLIRKKLNDLANSIAPRNWGILWRTSAAEIIQEDENILKEEIDRLTETSSQILKKFQELENVGIIYDGIPTINIEFPSLAKSKLDTVREEIEGLSTIPNHHYYKIFGEDFSYLINFTEELIHQIPQSKNEIIQEFQNYFKKFFPNKNDVVRIYHVKVDGRIFFLSPGVVLSFDKNNYQLKLRRDLGDKIQIPYDGIGVIKEEGDYAILECRLGDWFIKTEYFSKNNQSKGIYWNINTPVELYLNPFRLHYVDLEIDLIKRNNGEIQILDEEKLENAFKENYLSEKLKQVALDKLNEVKISLQKN